MLVLALNSTNTHDRPLALDELTYCSINTVISGIVLKLFCQWYMPQYADVKFVELTVKN